MLGKILADHMLCIAASYMSDRQNATALLRNGFD